MIFNEYTKNKYDILSSKVIPEEKLEIVELKHKKTSARVLLFICDDENRVFNIAFKTPVNDSKGTPHILEHSVLCGSRKYNVKDPFIELAKGSLNTFLNAMTFPDKTCYPVASANLKDFHNLMDVYMDAVFYPNAVKDEKIFMQEGWHYENEKNLTVNGVVYNEMKGVFSDPDSVLEYSVLKSIFPKNTYAYESGGKPEEIIDLTFDEFKAFHKKYYSATNSIIYLYGKLDYDEELKYLNDEYLEKQEKIDIDIKFDDTDNNDYNIVDYYNFDGDIKNKSYFAYTFALNEKKTSLRNIVIKIIDYILFSSDGAILKDKFMEEGFGESVYSKYEPGLKNIFYSIISQNVDETKKDKFIKLFDDSIKEIVSKGIDKDKLKAALNTIYFDYAEGEFGNYPRGLLLTLVSLDTYLYSDDYYSYIEYKEVFDRLNSEIEKKDNVFIKTIKELFIDNNHKVFNILLPKNGLSKEKEEKLNRVLAERKSHIDLAAITDSVKKLKEYQKKENTKEEMSCIPCLKASDFERNKKLIDYKYEVNDFVASVLCYDNDKDIIYIDLSLDISDFIKEEIYLFTIISFVIGKLDFEKETYEEFNNYVGINTGGIDVGLTALEDKLFFSYRLKTRAEKIEESFNVLFKLFSEPIFTDTKRISMFISELKSTSLNSLLSAGHVAALNRALSNIKKLASLSDRTSTNGIAFYKFIDAMYKNYDKYADLINESMTLLYKKFHQVEMFLFSSMNEKYHDDFFAKFRLFNQKCVRHRMRNIYTEIDEKKLKDNIKKISEFVKFDTFEKKVKKEAIVTPNDINFVAIGHKFDKKLFSGKLSILKTLFNYEYLWTNIRVLGGAYGCMSLVTRNGEYAFTSYRDPNLTKTNMCYSGVYDFLSKVNKSEDEFNKYIIGSLAPIDNPLSTVQKFKKNVAAYFSGITNEIANKERLELLDMKAKDLHELSDIYKDIDNADACALINSSSIEEAKKIYDTVWDISK